MNEIKFDLTLKKSIIDYLFNSVSVLLQTALERSGGGWVGEGAYSSFAESDFGNG